MLQVSLFQAGENLAIVPGTPDMPKGKDRRPPACFLRVGSAGGESAQDGSLDFANRVEFAIDQGLAESGSAQTRLDAVRSYENRFALILTPQEESDLVAFLSVL